MEKTRMIHHMNKQIRITMKNGREMEGKLQLFDKHMNIVLADTVEFRSSKKKGSSASKTPVVHQQSLGLILLRGAHVVSVSLLNTTPS